MLFGSAFLGKRPRQHEFGLEYRPSSLDHAVERCRHPAFYRMDHLSLHLDDSLTGVALVPAPIEILGDPPKLNDQIVV